MALIRLVGSSTTSSSTTSSSTTSPMSSELLREMLSNGSSTTETSGNNGSSTTTQSRVKGSSTTAECGSSTTKGQRVNAWKKENQDTIRWGVAKGVKAKLKAEAAKRGMTLTEMLKIAVFEYIHKED